MNAVYGTVKSTLLGLFMEGGMPGGATLSAVAVNDSYAFNATHNDISDIPVEAIVAGPTALSGVVRDGATLRADSLVFPSATVGEVCHAVVVFFTWGLETMLVAYLDETADNSLPQNLLTGELSIQWALAGICRI